MIPGMSMRVRPPAAGGPARMWSTLHHGREAVLAVVNAAGHRAVSCATRSSAGCVEPARVGPVTEDALQHLAHRVEETFAPVERPKCPATRWVWRSSVRCANSTGCVSALRQRLSLVLQYRGLREGDRRLAQDRSWINQGGQATARRGHGPPDALRQDLEAREGRTRMTDVVGHRTAAATSRSPRAVASRANGPH